jgi:UDP-GlcNAc:undecaprenyl-phosphate GlcNAc-1-phosphate transferase
VLNKNAIPFDPQPPSVASRHPGRDAVRDDSGHGGTALLGDPDQTKRPPSVREYLLICVVALAVTYLMTPFVRALAVVIKAVTPLRERDVHTVPIPRLGGVAIFAGLAAATVVARQLPYLKGVYVSGQMTGVLLGAAVICLIGAIDDVRELDWMTKFAGQVLAAGVMAYKGVIMLHVPFFGTSTVLPQPVLIGVTVLIVLVTTNAVNFIDGLDGLAAGIVAIAALAFFIYSYLLSYTFNPPNVFSHCDVRHRGDPGLLPGLPAAQLQPRPALHGRFGRAAARPAPRRRNDLDHRNVDPSAVSGDQVTAALLPIIAPLAVLSIPFLDMVLAVFRRARAGQKPWHPDSKHLHHRMLQIGHGHRGAVLILYLWAAVLAFGTVSWAIVGGWPTLAGIAVAVVVAVTLTAYLPRWMRNRRL